MTLHERMLLLHAIASEIVPDQIVELEDAASAAVDARTIELYKLGGWDRRQPLRHRALLTLLEAWRTHPRSVAPGRCSRCRAGRTPAPGCPRAGR